jgi:hypothetical protein
MVGWTAKRRGSLHNPGLLAEGVGQSSEPANAYKINDLEKAFAPTV